MTNFLTIITILSLANSINEQYSKYGGWTALKSNPTGFFRTEKIGDTWWLIDPDGYAFISKGVNHISYTADYAPSLGYSPYAQVTKEKYGNIDNWADATIKRLWNWNFNTIGAWSNYEIFDKGMPYTVIMDIGASAGASWLEGLFSDVFSQKFKDIAEKRAKEICQSRTDDPFLIGYFTDNELRWGADWRSNRTLFDDFMMMPKESDGKKALVATLAEIYENIDNFNSALQVKLNSFEDLFAINDISQLGESVRKAQSELFNRPQIRQKMPKEIAMLYLTQVYGGINKVNEAFGTNAESFNDLMTDEFLIRLTEEVSKQNLPREMIIAGIQMVYGNLDKANQAFNTNAKTYDELINTITGIQSISDVALEIKKIKSIFLKKVARQYFMVCRDAIRKYDPNHLILGCRFAGYAPNEVLSAMGEFVDVVSYNNYSPVPPIDQLDEIYEITKKPIMITEFSFKAMDSGLPNTRGAGAPVATQKDRADGFSKYVETFMKLPYAVGYHWFEYTDEPAEGRFDGENSNYGLVNIKDEVWEVLTNRMTEVNAKIESVHNSSTVKIPPVPNGHPRVYLRPSDVPNIKKKLDLPEFSRAWNLIKRSDNPACMAFVYLLTGNTGSGKDAIKRWFEYVDKYSNNPDYAGRVFSNLLHIGACVYDWCYDLLTDNEKQKFIKKLENIASSHSPGYPANPNGHAVVGHDTEGWILTGQIPAGIAIYDESKTMYDASARLFFEKFVPVRNFVYQSHMHHQGDSYFQTRFQHDQAVSWLFRRLGAGDVFSREQQFVAYQMIYNLRPDGQQLHSGDTFNERGNDPRKRLLALMTASYYSDPYLMTMAESDFFSEYGDFDCIFEILFKEPNAEKRPLNELPLTKYFPSPMGEMIARTGWNMGIDSNDAVVQMRIGEYFFGNHQCKDFGTFQIYYRGALAISSGVYDEYGNEHWKNYLHQTISKNGLLIFDPNEEMGKGSVNDGGQRWVEGSDHPKDLETLLTKDYKMGQVTAYEFGPDKLVPEYSYISGDITNAYSSKKVDKVTRSMVAFNTHNEKYPLIFVVMDRVKSKNPAFKKIWLLHSIQEPKIDNDTITIIRDGKVHKGEYSGKLVLKNLMPEKAEIKKIGGKGKEFWIESVQRNYPAHKEGITESGAWRVEISPSQSIEYDIFLNAMSVMDKKTQNIPEIAKIEQDNIIGARVLNYAVMFSKDGNLLDSAKIDINSNFKVLICDLESGVWVVKHNDLDVGEFKVSDDGKCLYFEGEKGVYRLVKKF